TCERPVPSNEGAPPDPKPPIVRVATPATRRKRMTIFGTRDSAYAMPAADTAPAEALDVAPAVSHREFGAVDMRRVILRVQGGDPILVRSAEGRESAAHI